MKPLVLVLTAYLAIGAVKLSVAQGLTPQESLRRIVVPEGLRADLIAAEPLVRQPVAIDWDDRGRLWVMQYLQYPNPEGLRRTQVDRYSRTVYDQVPAPPPRGPVGSDRLTILSDTDGDGRMDQSKDFVDGLNLGSGFAFGHSGVFVLNVPYLLFYPDVNGDDQPDSDPRVLLEGFGMQDAHSVANSLCFGPDGWLYGCQGSTVTSTIRGTQFQQGIWRYHPKFDNFELFCEGGGNSWGLDFDATGQLVYSTNYGGHVLLHGVQGGYYVKSFAKHGALHNPYTFGYFQHAPHANFTGGHVTVGGIVYQADRLGPQYRGKYLAADLLGHNAYWHRIKPLGSTFATEHGGSLMQSGDPWFAPSDLMCGPDGAIYIADWHDARMAHPDPDAQWDRSNGRIYRITSIDGPGRVEPVDMSKLDDRSLLDLCKSGNQWQVRRARLELVRRYANMLTPELGPPPSLIETLRHMALAHDDPQGALEAFWTWTSIAPKIASVSDSDWSKLLASPNEAIRRWSVRWIGDLSYMGLQGISTQLAHQLDELAETEPSVHVRQQLACTARRLEASIAMPMINANINRSIDLQDPFMPLLWWWAVERHCIDGNQEVLKRFLRPTLWKSELGRDRLLGLLVRRFAAEDSTDETNTLAFNSLIRLLTACPTPQERLRLWNFVDEGFQLRSTSDLALGDSNTSLASTSLKNLLVEDLKHYPRNLTLLQAAMRFDLSEASSACRLAMSQIDPNDATIAGYIDALATYPKDTDTKAIEAILDQTKIPAVTLSAAKYLSKLDREQINEKLIEFTASEHALQTKDSLVDLLLKRRKSALQLLQRVDAGLLAPSVISLERVRSLAEFDDSQIDDLVSKHWGRLKSATPEEKLAEVRRLNNDLRAGTGDSKRGKQIFQEHCASCHKLFGQGKELGPDLTSANRKDRDFLLVSIVDPSSVIRREYVSISVETKDGRILTGLVKNQEDGKISLQPQQGESIELSPDEIGNSKISEVSIMPEDLYRKWSEQDLRDLFAYLQSDP